LFFSSHDMSRHISRFGGDEDRAKLVAALMLTAKGVPFIYQGDEIGMRDWITDDISKMKDVQGIMGYKLALQADKSHEEALVIANAKSRDKSRTPMQWSSATNAGFSESMTWITIPADAYKINVEDQQNDPDSMLSFYKDLLRLRKEHSALMLGDYEFLRYETGMIYFVRKDSFEKIIVVLNFSEQPKTLDIAEDVKLLLSSKRKSLESDKVIKVAVGEAIILKGDTRL
jgi:glycosidase